MRTALLVGALAAALTLGGVAPAFADGTGSTAPAPSAVTGSTHDGTAEASERRLRSSLASLLPALPGRYTIELDGAQRLVRSSASKHREPASIHKLFIAHGVFTRLDAGTLRDTDRVRSGLTVRSSLRAMIEPSDDFAAQDLLARIGGTRSSERSARRGISPGRTGAWRVRPAP